MGNKTPTGNSLTADVMQIISRLENSEIQRFEKFAEEKRKQTHYRKLFQELLRRSQDGETSETVNESGVQHWAKQIFTKNKEEYDYASLIQNLHRKLLAFLAQEFRGLEEEKWRMEVEQGLWEVQALMDRSLFKQAVAHFNKIEKKIPKLRNHHISRDASLFTRVAQLKSNLAIVEGNLIHLSEADEFFYRFNKSAESFFAFGPPKSEDFWTFLMLESEHMYFYRLIYLHAREYEDFQEEIKAINEVVKKESADNRCLNTISKWGPYSHLDKNGESASSLVIYFWLLRKFKLAMDHNQPSLAWDALKELRGAIPADFNKALLAFVQLNHIELGIATYVRLKIDQPDAQIDPSELLKNLCLLSEDINDDIPLRLELNQCLISIFLADYQKGQAILENILKRTRNKRNLKIRMLEIILGQKLKPMDSYDLVLNLEEYLKKPPTRPLKSNLSTYAN